MSSRTVYPMSIEKLKKIQNKDVSYADVFKDTQFYICIQGFVKSVPDSQNIEIFDGTDTIMITFDRATDVEVNDVIKVLLILPKSLTIRPTNYFKVECGEQIIIHQLEAIKADRGVATSGAKGAASTTADEQGFLGGMFGFT